MADDVGYKLLNELLMLGAVTANLLRPGMHMAFPPEKEITESQTASLFIWADILKSRYRLTITMDPEGSDDDPADATEAADPQQPVAQGSPATEP